MIRQGTVMSKSGYFAGCERGISEPIPGPDHTAQRRDRGGTDRARQPCEPAAALVSSTLTYALLPLWQLRAVS